MDPQAVKWHQSSLGLPGGVQKGSWNASSGACTGGGGRGVYFIPIQAGSHGLGGRAVGEGRQDPWLQGGQWSSCLTGELASWPRMTHHGTCSPCDSRGVQRRVVRYIIWYSRISHCRQSMPSPCRSRHPADRCVHWKPCYDVRGARPRPGVWRLLRQLTWHLIRGASVLCMHGCSHAQAPAPGCHWPSSI